MRRLFLLVMLTGMLLPGCSGREAEITGLTFERGNGSACGDWVSLSLSQTQILSLQYVSAGTGQLQEWEQLPISDAQWQAIADALAQLPLEPARPSWLEKLFPRQDGGDYRRLTLVCGERQQTYRWPAGGEALEALLEQLITEVFLCE